MPWRKLIGSEQTRGAGWRHSVGPFRSCRPKPGFSIPHQDLVAGENDEPVTPLTWLAGGGSPETVADLADEI